MRRAIFLASVLLSTAAEAQHLYPLKYVGPVEARSAVSFGTPFPVLRSLADGRIQVIDTVRHRSVVMGASLTMLSDAADASDSRSGTVFVGPTHSDSAPLIRKSARGLDTLTRIRISTATMRLDTLNDGGMRWRATLEVLPTIDEYTVMPDGTVAVVRGADYHIDWYRPDGKRLATAPMQIDWRRMTDTEKQWRVDSTKAQYTAAYGETLSASDGPSIEFAEPRTLPDYMPPVFVGGVKSDVRGNVWIVPSSSSYAGYAGFMYDVVNARGQITERVRLPRNRVIVGFGADGAIYMMAMEVDGYYLEKTSLR